MTEKSMNASAGDLGGALSRQSIRFVDGFGAAAKFNTKLARLQQMEAGRAKLVYRELVKTFVSDKISAA